jgi:CarD family transcriptional regulator
MPQNLKKKVKAKTQTKVTKKPAAAKTVAKKAPAKKLVAKAVAKKVVAKKMVAKKPAVKAVAVKKAPVAKKAVAPKSVAKVVQPVAKAPVQKQVEAPKVVAKPAVAATKVAYKVGHHVVYPTHGVGKIVAEETQMIGDIELRMLVIAFEKDKMTLRVPVQRATAAGLRPVSSLDQIKKVFMTLKGRARTSRGMWSRRAQEYEAKINSGNIFSIAEVVRDLHQNVDQSERSYSERMIYESALSRLVGELAASESSDHKTATDKLMKLLRGKVAAAAALKEAA